MGASKESEADEAMKGLTQLFSDPSLSSKAHFRCSVDGPTELDLFFETIIDKLFSPDPNSKYKCWVRHLYRLGLISTIPREWRDPEDEEDCGSLRQDGDVLEDRDRRER